MTTYAEFCSRYDLDPAAEESREDWQRYQDELATLRSLLRPEQAEAVDHG